MFYRCPECGEDKQLKTMIEVTDTSIFFEVSNNGKITLSAKTNQELKDKLTELIEVVCVNCLHGGHATEFVLPSYTICDNVVGIPAFHTATCPSCNNKDSIICIGTNTEDSFEPTILWCPCEYQWTIGKFVDLDIPEHLTEPLQGAFADFML